MSIIEWLSKWKSLEMGRRYVVSWTWHFSCIFHLSIFNHLHSLFWQLSILPNNPPLLLSISSLNFISDSARKSITHCIQSHKVANSNVQLQRMTYFMNKLKPCSVYEGGQSSKASSTSSSSTQSTDSILPDMILSSLETPWSLTKGPNRASPSSVNKGTWRSSQ